MSSPFVWFDNIGKNRQKTSRFLTGFLGLQEQDVGSMTMMVTPGSGPFAGVTDPMADVSGWVPYIEVDDLGNSAKEAVSHGASLVAENMEGPAGNATFIRDPGGSVMALWKRAPAK